MRIVNYRGRWALVIRKDGGGRRRVSTGYAATEENRPLAERSARRILRDLAKPVGTDCQAIWSAYINDTTALSKARMQDAWKALKGTFAHLEPKDVTRQVCREYAVTRRNAGRKDSTIRSELIYLRAALRWNDRLTPAEFEMPPPAAPADRHLTRAEFRRLLHAADEVFHLKTFLHLAIATAARKEAILALRWEQVNWVAGTIWLGEKPSGKRRATVPMTAALRAILEEGHKVKGKAETIVNYAERPVTTIRRSLGRAAAAAKVPWVTPHVLRHSAAVWLAEAGHSMDEIAQFLGHSDSRITARVYARYSPAHLRKLADSLDLGETVISGSDEPTDHEQNMNHRPKPAASLDDGS